CQREQRISITTRLLRPPRSDAVNNPLSKQWLAGVSMPADGVLAELTAAYHEAAGRHENNAT
ncbi:hypothetical protein AB0M45_30950, partial [Nocardia sp. NPDC051787]|uniref:hypothetical protein n=1 Tax=Nocardia sp. NPDC051787 TaxID=3155415 RepID=UPI00341C45CC